MFCTRENYSRMDRYSKDYRRPSNRSKMSTSDYSGGRAQVSSHHRNIEDFRCRDSASQRKILDDIDLDDLELVEDTGEDSVMFAEENDYRTSSHKRDENDVYKSRSESSRMEAGHSSDNPSQRVRQSRINSPIKRTSRWSTGSTSSRSHQRSFTTGSTSTTSSRSSLERSERGEIEYYSGTGRFTAREHQDHVRSLADRSEKRRRNEKRDRRATTSERSSRRSSERRSHRDRENHDISYYVRLSPPVYSSDTETSSCGTLPYTTTDFSIPQRWSLPFNERSSYHSPSVEEFSIRSAEGPEFDRSAPRTHRSLTNLELTCMRPVTPLDTSNVTPIEGGVMAVSSESDIVSLVEDLEDGELKEDFEEEIIHLKFISLRRMRRHERKSLALGSFVTVREFRTESDIQTKSNEIQTNTTDPMFYTAVFLGWTDVHKNKARMQIGSATKTVHKDNLFIPIDE